jgi:hypothetical protein
MVRAHPHDLTRHCDVDETSRCWGLATLHSEASPSPRYERFLVMRCSACAAIVQAQGVLPEPVAEVRDAWDEDWGGGV